MFNTFAQGRGACCLQAGVVTNQAAAGLALLSANDGEQTQRALNKEGHPLGSPLVLDWLVHD
ncbi:MAG: hypothetical protein ACOYXA_13355 [Bacteroidota bacterium]